MCMLEGGVETPKNYSFNKFQGHNTVFLALITNAVH